MLYVKNVGQNYVDDDTPLETEMPFAYEFINEYILAVRGENFESALKIIASSTSSEIEKFAQVFVYLSIVLRVTEHDYEQILKAIDNKMTVEQRTKFQPPPYSETFEPSSWQSQELREKTLEVALSYKISEVIYLFLDTDSPFEMTSEDLIGIVRLSDHNLIDRIVYEHSIKVKRKARGNLVRNILDRLCEDGISARLSHARYLDFVSAQLDE